MFFIVLFKLFGLLAPKDIKTISVFQPFPDVVYYRNASSVLKQISISLSYSIPFNYRLGTDSHLSQGMSYALVEYSTVDVKCRTAIQSLCLYFDQCQCMMLEISHVHLNPNPFFIPFLYIKLHTDGNTFMMFPYSCYEGFMVFNATFNNISAISWRSVLLVEETGVPEENHRPVTSN